MNLKNKTINGIKWTSVSSAIIAFMQLIQLSVLAHYLQPSDFGLMAIVVVVIGFSSLFLDLGISASIIHRQDITHIQLSSLYWLNIFSGILLFIMVYFLAPILENFYEESKLVPIVQLLAISFIISSIGSQYGVLFQKALKFNVIAKISIVSVFAGLVIAIISAINGLGVYSLVYASLTTAIVGTFMNVLIGIKDHKPSLTYQHKEIIPMLSFGAFQMGERSINYFNSQFDVILIGKLLGTEVLGIYSVAKTLSMYPANIINPIITKVTFPIMAKLQNDIPQLKAIYLKIINYISSINFPIYVLLILLAEPIILTLFGEKWKDSITILQILSIYAAIRSTGNPIGSLLLARGRADLGFYWNLLMFFFMPITIYMGSYWGLTGIAYSLVGLMMFLLIVPNWYFLVRPLCGADFKEYVWQILQPLIFAMIGGIFSYEISLFFDIKNIILNAIVVSVVVGVVVFVLNSIFNRKFINTLFLLIKKER